MGDMTIDLDQRIAAFDKLGRYIESHDERLDAYVQRTAHHNPWFTVENQWRMLDAIAAQYLSAEKLRAWTSSAPALEATYGQAVPSTSSPRLRSAKAADAGKTVGLVMAGNIPLVGFHDWMTVLLCGHRAQVKLSDKDPYVLPYLSKKLEELGGMPEGATSFVERLKDFDAVIATGSDNTARYFKQYFGKYPHIIRGNRTSVAVLHGTETQAELQALADDVFAYFGMGCRSISKLYVPEGYQFEALLEVLHEHKQLANHSKWRNNYDYNYALYAINKEPFLMTGPVLLRESDELHSRLATLHYEHYADLANVAIDLNAVKEQLQVVVSAAPVPGLQVTSPGKAQQPALDDYADGVNTLAFLATLS